MEIIFFSILILSVLVFASLSAFNTYRMFKYHKDKDYSDKQKEKIIKKLEIVSSENNKEISDIIDNLKKSESKLFNHDYLIYSNKKNIESNSNNIFQNYESLNNIDDKFEKISVDVSSNIDLLESQ